MNGDDRGRRGPAPGRPPGRPPGSGTAEDRRDAGRRRSPAELAAAAGRALRRPGRARRRARTCPAPRASAASYGARPPIGAPGRRRPRWRRRIGAVLVVLLVLIVGFAVYIDFSIGRTDALPASSTASSEGTNWLIVGSDSRQQLTEAERKEYATGDETSQLTDTIMLLHTGSGPTTLVSMPRDSLVNIPGFGVAKINSAYGKGGGPEGGGPELLVKTVEQRHRPADRPLRRDRLPRHRQRRRRHRRRVPLRPRVDQGPQGGAEHQGGLPDPRQGHRARLRPHPRHGVVGLRAGRAAAGVPVRDAARRSPGRRCCSTRSGWCRWPPSCRRRSPSTAATTSGTSPSSGWPCGRIGSGISTTVPVADGEVHWDKKRASALFQALANDQAPPQNALGP